MQKYRLIIILLILISCEGLFHDDDNEYLIIDSRQEKIDLLNGIYTRLVKVHDGNYFTALARSDDVNVYINYSFSYTDENGPHDCYHPGGTIDFNEVTGNIYLNLYTAIVSINRLLMVLSESEDPEIAGELYFLRAYCYFKLARLFGTPPLVTDIDVNYFVEKPTYREVYEFIESDMLKAIELLPETYTSARIPGETPNQGTAKALLAEIYLAMAGFPVNDVAKYAEAARLAGEVIEQAEQYNYRLLDDLVDLWKTKHRHNRETIFGLYFNGDDTKNEISNLSISIIVLSITSNYNPEFKFFNTFPNNYRKYNSFVTGNYYCNFFDTLYQPGSLSISTVRSESGLVFVPYDPLVNPCEFVDYAVSLKWLDRGAYNLGEAQWDWWSETGGSGVTLYLLRYAQTLLTYAEAKARSGALDESAYEAVNQIRRRANKLDIFTPSQFDLPPDLTPGQFLDSVVWERAWELCTEPEGRWFDIVRLDLRSKLAGYRYPQDQPTKVSDDLLNEDWYFYLIPQEDRWLNPNFSETINE